MFCKTESSRQGIDWKFRECSKLCVQATLSTFKLSYGRSPLEGNTVCTGRILDRTLIPKGWSWKWERDVEHLFAEEENIRKMYTEVVKCRIVAW